MNLDKIAEICARVMEETFRPLVPYTPADTLVTGPDGITRLRRHSTGNMRRNATKFEIINDKKFVVKVDSSVAPYAVYTNEPWQSPYWRGKQNPNEGWFQKAALAYAEALATALGGTIRSDAEK